MRTIYSNNCIFRIPVQIAGVLLFAAGAAFGQDPSINLTAAPTQIITPDGNTTQMWGYTCGAAITGSTAACAALNTHAPAAVGTTPAGWSPVVITVPYTATGTTSTTTLTINLTNSLSFANGNTVPTSLVIVGQLGGGLGDVTQRTVTASPDHSNAQAVTWPIAGTAPGVPPNVAVNGGGTPPAQGPRVQSFGTEVGVTPGTGQCATNPCPLTWNGLRPGTYLLQSGTHPSIQVPMGLIGMVVVTTAPAGATPGTAYPDGTAAVIYNAEVPMLFSEIDPVQNNAASTAVNTAGFLETNVWSGLPGGCGNPNSGAGVYQTCYPPAVNYTPLYYLINGVAFNKANTAFSLFPTAPATGLTAGTGQVLVRLVNAGLRMHVPSIVGAQIGAARPGDGPPSGFALIAEDGNRLPGVPRIQNEVFMAAGKTYDVMMNVPAAGAAALPIFDRQLSLAGNGVGRDGGMLAYISANSAAAPSVASVAAAANPDNYTVHAGQNLVISDPAKGLLGNDVGIYGVQVQGTPPAGLTMNANGTFTYTGGVTTSFTYCGNGATTGAQCALVNLTLCTGTCLEAATGIVMSNITYAPPTVNALNVKINPPGILSVDKDNAGYPLTVNLATASTPLAVALTGTGCGTATVDMNGGFTASASAAGTCTFTYNAKNAQGVVSSATATVTIVFPAATGLAVTVKDGTDKTTLITDYRWIIEEDRTFYINPNTTTNNGTSIVPTFGTNFHTSYMPVIATGCTGPLSCESLQTIYDNGVPCIGVNNPVGCSPTAGQHINAVCDVGNGVCRPDTAGAGFAAVNPNKVHLDPTKRYYISVLPGDAATPFNNANLTASCANGSAKAPDPTVCGHGMGGAPISAGQTAVTVYTQPTPLPPAKLSVFVFEDDFPLNGEQDGAGGVDVLSPNEPGLGNFQITLFDDAGGTGDATGQPTYDMFNQPLTNSLAGMIDPVTQMDACPIVQTPRTGTNPDGSYDKTQTGITGMIVTCPKYESDGKTLSPLAGQAVVANMYPGRYGVVATPGADRIARGEEWLQTNTLDGQKAHDSFLRIGEPSFFQEYGPAGFHVSIGFANPAIINARKQYVCNGTDPNISGVNCLNTVTGQVTTERLSRTPDERLYSSGSYDSFGFTQCYVSFGDADGEDFAFTKCNPDGTFSLTGLPDGDWRITVFDQWNDTLVDGLSTPVRLGTVVNGSPQRNVNMGDIAMNQWQANIYTATFNDLNRDGVRQATEPGLTLVPTNIRFRDGSFSNFNNTDLEGNAGFNEVFPLFSWYVVETDNTRYKNTGTHVVYDAGGPADSTCTGGTSFTATAPCGNSSIGVNMANTAERVSVPVALRVPGAVYCASADCTGKSIANGAGSSDPPSACTTSPSTGQTTCSTLLSTGRIDPPWVVSEGWQGFSGQNSFIEFGKTPYTAGENGGIRGHVIYASTRPFDDPRLLLQTSWEPLVPGVTINLYQEGTATDGTQSLKLVDTTKTSSFDDWAQGFWPGDSKPYMSCPGQLGNPTNTAAGDLFFFSLFNQPSWLDQYNNGGTPAHTIPNNSQFKCYDGMHNWNQIQPAPYDGMYQFPSIAGRNTTTGAPTGGTNPSVVGTNCTICVANPIDGTPMLPVGKYVVEVVVPPGYELVKEEDKNILIGDNYIAPATVQFPGLGGAIYILPDQAAIGATFNATNFQNPTQDLGRPILPQGEGDTGSVEQFWPCVGALRVVPDFISLFPQSTEVAPFAGSLRNLCDRKEVTLTDQSAALAKFYIFTSTHVAAHFTGVITDDFTSEFDPFSPQFGEKFSPPDLPISIKDWTGTEISRTYADHWGAYNGLTYSTWEVNPPNPTGYGPTMMVTCMNDPGTGPTPDPLFNPAYSQFCYEIPFMPGQTQYMDTPVVPTSAFAGAGYNNVDCNYPTGTPAIKEVDGDGIGPWVSAAGHTITITSLGAAVSVANYGYSGPSATTAPFNAKTVTRDYSFGTTAGTVALADGNGILHPLGSVSWGATTITGTVPSGMPNCNIQQQIQYSGLAASATAQCGQLVITRGDNNRTTVDTVTVTIGGKAPTHVAATASIQAAIDAAKPGDMLMIDPTCTTAAGAAVACTTAGTTHSASSHQEILIMWKPLRLQGVGAASSVLNANTHPAGKMDAWRRQVNCLFGLALNGTAIDTHSAIQNPFDPTGTFSCGSTNGTPWVAFKPYGGSGDNNPQVDRLPLEATVGWDANLNGNLAELLQEPSLMGALEGAAITVLSKGVNFPSNPFDSTLLAGFPVGTPLLTNSTSTRTGCGSNQSTSVNPFPSNFWCNPSSIDGLSITNSSQGGGGIFVHGWGHNIQIANNRIQNNSGTLSGGINVGQGEFPPAYVQGSATNADPNSCWGLISGIGLSGTLPTNTQLPYCHNLLVNVHNNAVMLNSSTGDELFSATPAGSGGVNFCTGSDLYQFNYNWVCGNLSTGDGGGLGHLGFSWQGKISHNSFLFNQSTNPTIPANGGAMVVMGAPDADPTCGATTDLDCIPATAGALAPSDGAGPGLVIDANLIMGNGAESGSGGGIRLQQINGTDVVTFPNNPERWHMVNVTNNIIANNVAGWDGAGISLQDALNVNIINNTVMSNDTTASSGVLFNTIGAPLASSQGPCPVTRNPDGTCPVPVTASTPQPAGLVAVQNSPVLVANLPATITCPAGHGVGGGNPSNPSVNGVCRAVSYPELYNDVFWQNRVFNIGVGSLGTGPINQQNVVSLFNGFTSSQVASQTATGACVSGTSYWDIGIRGDTGPANHSLVYNGNPVSLAPEASFLTSTAGYIGGGTGFRVNSGSNPTVVSQYCNGSRVPPESVCKNAAGLTVPCGWQVPPGISDATVPNPVFNLTPAATVDEGNNWINISWGPLSLVNPQSNVVLGNYAPQATSTVINYICATPQTGCAVTSSTTYAAAPPTDFFGNFRKTDNRVDAGAVEFGATGAGQGAAITSIAPTSGMRGTTVAVTITGTNLNGATAVAMALPTGVTGTNGVTCTISGTPTATTVNANCTIVGTGSTPATLGSRNVTVTTPLGPATLNNGFTVTANAFAGPTPALTSVPANTTTKTGTITFTNPGPTAFVIAAAPTITKVGTAGGAFSITGGTCVNGLSVGTTAGSNTCTITVQYAPGTSTATATANVSLNGGTSGTLTSANFTAN